VIYAASHLAGDRRLACDVCVIGTGAGGGPVAYHAAKRGLSVIVLEAGSYFRPQDFNQIEYDMFARLYQDKAARATRDGAIRVFEGKGVGGGTLVNLNVCARLPPEVFAAWRKEHGLRPLTFERLGAPYNSTKGRPGGGLGLFLSVNVARTLGGRLSAQNRPQGGALVIVTLPMSAIAIEERDHDD